MRTSARTSGCWPRSTSIWTTYCRRSSRGPRSTASSDPRSRASASAAGGGGAPGGAELGVGSRVPGPLRSPGRPCAGRVAASSRHLVRRRDRARLQHDPRRERRPATGRQGRRTGRSDGSDPPPNQPAAAAFRPVPRLLERHRAGRPPHRGRLPVSDQVTAEFIAATLVRWLGLLALATLVGSGVLETVVLPRGRPELVAVRRRLGRGDAIAVLALLVATAGELLMRTRTMSGADFAQAVAAVPLVLERTHFGTSWVLPARAAGLPPAPVPAPSRPARVPAPRPRAGRPPTLR